MTAHAGSRLAWLALTPEPERELPAPVAFLRQALGTTGGSETRTVQRLVLRGTGRSWRRYLREITELTHLAANRVAAADPAETAGRELAAAALLVGEVVLEHHRMLIGLPGAGYRETAQDRQALSETVAGLATWLAADAPADSSQEGGR